MAKKTRKNWQHKRGAARDWRMDALRYGMLAAAALIALRLFSLQVMDHAFYEALASGQHEIFKELVPSRGEVYVQDAKDGSLVPIATNHRLAFIYADPRHVEDPDETAETLAEIFGYSEEREEALAERLDRPEDPYEPIERGVEDRVLERILGEELPGIKHLSEESRLYPEADLGGHVIGFLGSDEDGGKSGKYGIEGYFEDALAGKPGFLQSERDIAGRIISVGEQSIEPAVDGADVVLTIDRTIQYRVCEMLDEAVRRHGADGGSVVVLEPATGRVLAMCGAPDYDPNHYAEAEDITVFNNPAVFNSYEPGSIFKPFTMAAALDTGAVTPNTTYEDTGEVELDVYTVKNSDEKAYGMQTMTQVLEKSLNTGVIHAMRETGRQVFAEYVRRFGFGKKTGIQLETESAGDIRPLLNDQDIYAATASYGQGITVTPLQIAAGYAAIANGGVLKAPHVVSEVRYADGTVKERSDQDVRRVIEEKTSRLLSAMLISVVEFGHGNNALVPGYYIAGKTGTAQVARSDGPGYREDETIASFAGFGPADDPRFAMVVRLDHPRSAPWASATAAPLFGDITEFLLQYFEVPPTR